MSRDMQRNSESRRAQRWQETIWRLLSLTLALMMATGLLIQTASAEEPELIPLDEHLIVYETKESTAVSGDANGSGFVRLSYSPLAELDRETKVIRMMFTNPVMSTHDMVIELYMTSEDEQGEETEVLMARSGRIPAGCGIEQMTYLGEESELPEGEVKGKYRLSFYDPVAGQAAVTDFVLTGIQVTVAK